MITEDLTITLPADLAASVRKRVANGEYESVSDAVEDSLMALIEGDPFSGPAFDAWVRDQLQPAIAAHDADPSRGIPVNEVRRELDILYAQHRAAG